MSLDIPVGLLSFLQNGNLRIACDGIPSINFAAEGDSLIIDIIEIPVKITKKPGLIRRLSEAKDLARNLRQENITLEIRLQGEPVLRLGEKANPRLAKVVTLSGDIEIADLRRLKKLSEAFG